MNYKGEYTESRGKRLRKITKGYDALQKQVNKNYQFLDLLHLGTAFNDFYCVTPTLSRYEFTFCLMLEVGVIDHELFSVGFALYLV